MRRRHVGLPLLTAIALVPLAAGTASANTSDTLTTVPASRTLLVAGHGWGHGHGLSQEGARAAAEVKHLSATSIVSFYYPHTASGSIGNPTMLIKLTGAPHNGVTVLRPYGSGAHLSLHDLATDKRMSLPRTPARWQITAGTTQMHVWQYSNGTWTRWPNASAAWDGPLTLGVTDTAEAAPMRVLYPDGDERDYRGYMKMVQTGDDQQTSMAVMPMESYLRGVVPRESPSSYPAAALQAQAIAARTYAEYNREHSGGREYHICDSTQCQVFGGTREVTPSGTALDLEPASTDDAVAKTAGRIRTYGGSAIFAQFSASNGGWSTDGAQPYLIAQRDPYDGLTHTLSHAWTARVPASVLESRWPSIGRLLRVRVSNRDGHGDWGGRVLSVVLEGSSGSVTVTGQDFYNAYSWPAHSTGMRSSWWQIIPAASDVNGDGTSDLVTGIPGRDGTGASGAGAVAYQPGSSDGVASSGGRLISQSSSGVPGASEAGDGFGSAVATGDFNGDGKADVAVGVPGEDIGPDHDAGMVAVFPGSSSGVSTSGVRLFSQDSDGIDGVPESGDRFGAALATGDFNGDGYADLVIGVPGEELDGRPGAGMVTVIPGSSSGLDSTHATSFSQQSAGVPGSPESGDNFGAAVAAGDMTRDGRDDLIVGSPGEKVGTKASGAVVVLVGSSSGVTGAGSVGRTGSDFGNPALGRSLASADFNRDGYSDVVAGGTGSGSGAVTLLYGGPSVFNGTTRTITQSSSGVPGASEAGDNFGYAVAAADIDEDGYADVAVGASGENVGDISNAGAVTLLYGSSDGVTGTRARLITQSGSAVQGAAQAGDEMGRTVSLVDVTGDRLADLVAGSPGNGGGSGSLNVLRGTETGLTAVGDQLVYISSAGTGASNASGDRFGSAVAEY